MYNNFNACILYHSQTVFDKEKAKKKADKGAMGDYVDIPDIDEVLDAKGGGGGKKRMSVERLYQKKSQLEHILLRPDTYIGSVETLTQVSLM